ncbi:MAG: formylglycine-generating enzyme family protein, partial [Kiritimatiellia bacterium]
MSGMRPEEDEVLQAVDLQADAPSAAPPKRRWAGSLLLFGLLMLWAAVVSWFFNRRPPENPEPPLPPAARATAALEETSEPVPSSPPTATPRSAPQLEIQSNPSASTVLINNLFAGTTPFASSEARPGDEILFQLSGYEPERFPLTDSHFEEGLQVSLRPLQAWLRIRIFPAESRLTLNGRAFELPEGGRLQLPLLPQVLTVEAEGYESQTLRFTPAQAYERSIELTLKPVPAVEAPAEGNAGQGPAPAAERMIETAEGLKMILPDFPVVARMGSERGTAGRQSNEGVLNIKLSRAFRISQTEISNRQFRKFRPAHDSGSWKGVDLNADSLPVSGVSWEDAVAFCNWLSVQENLPPAYIQNAEGWTFQENPGTGYRLPTEAEWEALSRLEVKGALFGWGDQMPPPAGKVNVAGKESQRLFPAVVENYSDAAAGPLPVEEAGLGPL